MSTSLESLRQVVGARSGRRGHLLQTCRFEGFGCEVIGGHNVGDVFKTAPFVVASKPHFVAQESTLAVLDADNEGNPVCFFADTYENRIGRLWRVGPALTVPLPPGPKISVPFDPRMSQVAPRVAFNEADHVDLDSAAAAHIPSVAKSLCDSTSDSGRTSSVRRTAFVHRAVSEGPKCAVLLQLHELITDPVRRSHFRLAAVFFRFAGDRILHSVVCIDGSTSGNWSPRVKSLTPAATESLAS